jgi:hypothetical protein
MDILLTALPWIIAYFFVGACAAAAMYVCDEDEGVPADERPGVKYATIAVVWPFLTITALLIKTYR